MTAGGVVVRGVPVQQGSKIARIIPGPKPRAVVVDDNKPQLKSWRVAALAAIRMAHPDLTSAAPVFGEHVPVALQVRFVFPLRVQDRATIKRWEKSGEEPHPCQPGCVHLPWHAVTPDKDKCLRAVFDVLKLGHVWHDDAQCARFDALAYRGEHPMTMIRWAGM